MVADTLFGSGQDAPAECKQPAKSRPTGVRPKLKRINRDQCVLRAIDVEELIGPKHTARVIWEFIGKLNLHRFTERVVSAEGGDGAPSWNPRLLLSIWVYAYSEGITSAREIARLMEYEPGLMWLTGLDVVNYHTLSDFRRCYRDALADISAQLLVAMEKAGMVDLRVITQDGTKILAQAGPGSFRTRERIGARLDEVRALLAVLEEEQPEAEPRRKAARARAAREQAERLEAAFQTVEQSGKERASTSDPDARMMRTQQGGVVPAYNVQVSTDAKQGVVIRAEVTQDGNDTGQLLPALDAIKETYGHDPEQVLVDGGYSTRANVRDAAERKIDLVGSVGDQVARQANARKSAGVSEEFRAEVFVQIDNKQLECPAGQVLYYWRRNKKHGVTYRYYQAAAGVCSQCPHAAQCCPKSGRRMVLLRDEDPRIETFRDKMQRPEYKALYRRRSAVAEFVHLWWKEKIGLRRFRLRGLFNVQTEIMWACFTYNLQLFLRAL